MSVVQHLMSGLHLQFLAMQMEVKLLSKTKQLQIIWLLARIFLDAKTPLMFLLVLFLNLLYLQVQIFMHLLENRLI